MNLTVITPYLPKKNLGHAYNVAMESSDGWVIFHDDDVFLRTQPKWYDICIAAIEQVGHDAGFITCVTNRIACPQQRCVDAPKGNDLIKHIEYAEQRYHKWGNAVVEIPRVKPSGFFFITNTTVWNNAGKFPPGFLGVDNRYANQVKKAGYKVYMMEGLYVYHMYRREWKSK